MRRLIVNPGTESAWEIPLPNGTVNLGRVEGNQCVIAHPSISSHHCEISSTDFGVTIKDLGSSNGTYIDGKPVAEAALLPGQMLQLGEVRLQLDQPTAPVITARITSNAVCKFHPHNSARHLCPKCHGHFCEMCVNSRFAGGKNKYFCRACAAECAPLTPVSAAEDEVEKTFGSQILDAFMYPFKGDGLILIAVGTVFFLILEGTRSIAKYGLIYGWVAMGFLTVLGTGYLMAYLRRILNASALGEEEMPEWPEISDYSNDIVSPFRQLMVTILVCFAPAIGLTIYAAGSSSTDTAWLGWATPALMVLGCVYFPMAFMAVAMFDSVVALNPLLIIPSIAKVLKEYLLTVVMLSFILLLRWLLNGHLKTLLPVPLLPTILLSLIQLYLMIVEMRILGLLYRNKKYELGWFT